MDHSHALELVITTQEDYIRIKRLVAILPRCRLCLRFISMIAWFETLQHAAKTQSMWQQNVICLVRDYWGDVHYGSSRAVPRYHDANLPLVHTDVVLFTPEITRKRIGDEWWYSFMPPEFQITYEEIQTAFPNLCKLYAQGRQHIGFFKYIGSALCDADTSLRQQQEGFDGGEMSLENDGVWLDRVRQIYSNFEKWLRLNWV
ncbi:MAG TPA: hypothetical protein VJL60_04305, partial [Gammaproteobacteria bacterium]|nr:hypothetical protein [Gammaproteobacteria bacterium]